MTRSVPAAFDHLLDAWNETEPGLIRGHIDKALAPDILFADPGNLSRGRDEFERMVRAFRAQGPGLRIERGEGFDCHHDRYRYLWRAMMGSHAIADGMDVAEIGADGLILRIDAFFGTLASA